MIPGAGVFDLRQLAPVKDADLTAALAPALEVSRPGSNSFAVAGHDGPYRVRLRVEEGRLAIELLGEDGAAHETIRMGLARFRRPIRDYFQICESYFRAVRSDGAKGIEAIDMARRGLHNEAAELLQESLAGKVEMDFDTARRLFTLICVLHIKQSTTAVDSHGPGHASRPA